MSDAMPCKHVRIYPNMARVTDYSTGKIEIVNCPWCEIESLQAKLEVARDMVSLALTKLDQPRSFPYVDDTKKVLIEALHFYPGRQSHE